ncbi:hypothetical protein CI238_04623 [Colletotrichum incanum]|uniref:Uncharacterized protein n=1 Tax=Colletotrichum incanum TaxID=1573173 RepID=A0A162N4A8_COLIC|nr:hypothetical protein CI238_04623 [Colletotrichum incanum]
MITADGLDHPISLKLCKRLNRFFEALSILSSLQTACGRNSQFTATSDTSVSEESHSRTLECFINKLAQTCDNKRHGPTVTSLAIVRPPDKLLYAFASNQRSHEDNEEARGFVFSILHYVNQVCAEPCFRDDECSTVFRHVLRNILNFNHERIQHYRQSLLERLDQCLRDCERCTSEQSKFVHSLGVWTRNEARLMSLDTSLKAVLLPIQQIALLPSDEPTEDDGVSSTSSKNEELVRAATALRQSPAFNDIVDKGKAGKIDESQHWCELQHFIGRLASYFRATQAILGARKSHPELFAMEGLEIHFIDSSKPIPNPMNAFQAGLPPTQRDTVRSAHAIISRMTSDKGKQEVYQQYADELQRCGLDDLIAKQCRKKTFRPIAHSEVLLLEWLRSEFAEETHSIPFYSGVKYIGCSKPTCRLCEYYFAAHSSGVRVRPPHRNVYPNWVVPDVLVEGETSQYKARMIDAVLGRVRDDVFMALREKVSERKRFDSNTYSSQPTYESLADISDDLDDLVSQVGGILIASRSRISCAEVRSNMRIGDDAWSVVAQNDETDEDNDGGVLMFTGRNMRSKDYLDV